MRAISAIGDPQRLVLDYYRRMTRVFPTDGFAGVSRRDLPPPCYRITRSDRYGMEFDPWKHGHAKPVFDRGLLGDLLYAGEPIIVDDLRGRIPPDDPAAEFLEGRRSLMGVPMYDEGEAANMTFFLRDAPGAFDRDRLADHVWVTNLFGRATGNLVLRQKYARTADRLRRELEAVGEIQRGLLPERLPEVPGLRVAAHYEASEQAGGDYYDFFDLPGGRLGMLLADVSGHGTPAAVLMAVVHALAHAIDDPPSAEPPGRLLAHLNRHLCERYTKRGGTFVTAWAGVYDPATRGLTFANAGHPPPRRKADNSRGGAATALAGHARSLPLGIDPGERFEDAAVTLDPGDVVVAYTDGITEARSPTRGMWGVEGLDAALLGCSCDPAGLVDDLIARLGGFTGGDRAEDDRTVVAVKVA